MHDAPTVRLPVPAPAGTAGRHRRLVIAPERRRLGRVAGVAGSLVSLSALALLGIAVAASLSSGPAPDEVPTLTVTYDTRH